MELGFANRKTELDYICGPTPDSQIIIDAPAGYGKSFLLDEIKRQYKIAGWNCAQIKLDEVRGKSAIRNLIMQQLNIKIDAELGEDDIDAELRKSFASHGKILLLVDAEERAVDDDRDWLIANFIPSCFKGLTGLYFRVIVTGRYTGTFEGRRTLYKGYRRIGLEPFNQTTIQQLLESAINANPPRERELSETYVLAWAEKILMLSGGHPKSIQKLINALIESNWTLPITKEEDKRLFKKYIDYEVQYLTKDLDDLTKKALEILSIFRQISFSTIKALQKRSYLPKETHSLDILACLTKIGLVSKKDNQVFYSDAIVRQFVLAEMKVFDPVRYRDLNSIAVEIYDEWLMNLLRPNIEYAVDPLDLVTLFTKEGIYHLCQLLSQPNAIDDFARHLRTYSETLVSVLGESKSDPQRKIMLNDLLSSDNEIQISLFDHDITVDTLLKLAFSRDNPSEGGNYMYADKKNIIESLVGIIEFLRRNAENVLVERWEKRNRGKAVTPPAFNDTSISGDKIRKDISQKMDLILSLGGSKTAHVFNYQHVESLLTQAKSAQSTIDKFEEALSKPLDSKEKIRLESERDEYQAKMDHTVEEMADLLTQLYSEGE